jgi:hypothetical protein
MNVVNVHTSSGIPESLSSELSSMAGIPSRSEVLSVTSSSKRGLSVLVIDSKVGDASKDGPGDPSRTSSHESLSESFKGKNWIFIFNKLVTVTTTHKFMLSVEKP